MNNKPIKNTKKYGNPAHSGRGFFANPIVIDSISKIGKYEIAIFIVIALLIAVAIVASILGFVLMPADYAVEPCRQSIEYSNNLQFYYKNLPKPA